MTGVYTVRRNVEQWPRMRGCDRGGARCDRETVRHTVARYGVAPAASGRHCFALCGRFFVRARRVLAALATFSNTLFRQQYECGCLQAGRESPIMAMIASRSSFVSLVSILAGFCVAGIAQTAHAGASERLKEFVQATHSGRVAFEQVVTAKNGKAPARASGSFAFSRPGKFRWTYNKPYEQVIVGDGDKLWFYDKDLNQVTVRKLGNALGATPAAILAGSNDLASNFNLEDKGVRDGLDWLDARPKSNDTSFQIIRLGFNGNELAAMELEDTFGQLTKLRFARFERNPALPADTFRFTPPPGADVAGE